MFRISLSSFRTMYFFLGWKLELLLYPSFFSKLQLFSVSLKD